MRVGSRKSGVAVEMGRLSTTMVIIIAGMASCSKHL